MRSRSRTTNYGFEELDRALAALGNPQEADRIGTKVGGYVMRHIVLPAIKEALPVGTRSTRRRRKRKDGTYAEADYGRVTTNIRVRKKRKAAGQTALVWSISTNHAFWWWMNEFGTVSQPANPVISRTWARIGPDLPMEIGGRLWSALELTAQRHGGGRRYGKPNATGRST